MPTVRFDGIPDLITRPPCRALMAVAGDRTCHVVGGAVRDCLLHRDHHDLDLLVDRDGAAIAKELAARLGARPVALGGDRFASWRIVGGGETVDLWDRNGEPLERELARRDLTVNALAVRLPAGELEDPLGALADLRAGHLRPPDASNFLADPLRVLRLVRLAAELPGFAPDAAALVAARAASCEIDGVASERVRDEWLRLARSIDPAASARLLLAVGLYPLLWSGEDELDSEPTVLALESLPEVHAELGELAPRASPPGARGIAFDLLLIAGLGRPDAIVARLLRRRFRTIEEARRLRRLLAWDRLPGCDAARRRFLHQLAADWTTGLLWLGARALAGHERAHWRRATRLLVDLAERQGTSLAEPPTLLGGSELRRSTGLSGPALGRALDAIREAQVLGTVTTPDQALTLVHRLHHLRVW